MKHQPLKRYRTPGYPTKLQVLGRRELLEKHWPEAWAKIGGITGVAGVMLTVGGCAGVAAPPAFLSEEEMLQVVAQEMPQSDVAAVDRNGASVPVRPEDDISMSSVPEAASGRLRMLAARDVSKGLVREQVADFVDWLKAQGAI